MDPDALDFKMREWALHLYREKVTSDSLFDQANSEVLGGADLAAFHTRRLAMYVRIMEKLYDNRS